jgi:precorrin-2 dehydrogenase/sirohydrochlorin ferrochelatase
MSYYPINIRIANRLCLVVGGGSVAYRKVQGLLQGGARVRVISPEVGPELQELSELQKIEWLKRDYVEGDLRGGFLAFAVTDDCAVQAMIMKEAEKSAVLLNSADDPRGSDFHVPAHFRRGKMLITVSTGGGSPALAKKIREQLENDIVPEYEAVVDLLALVRDQVVRSNEDSAAHAELFRRLLQLGIVDLLLKARWFDLQMLLLRELPEEVDAVALMRQFLEKHDTTGS